MADQVAPVQSQQDQTLTPLDLYKTLRVVFALSPEDSYSPVSGQKLVFEIQSRLEAKQPSQTITTPEQAAARVDALAADISASFQGTEFPISKDQVAGLINASVAVVENLNAETFANNLTAAQLQSISSVANRAGFQNEGLDAQAATAFVLSTEKQAIKVSVGLGVDLANTALQDVGAAIEAKLNGLSAQDAQVFAANSGMTVDQAKLLAQATTGLGAAKVMSGQVFDSLYGVRNVDMRPGDRGAVTTADIPPTASTQGGEGAPASVVQDRLRGVGIQLGVELVSGTPEEIQKGLDARLAEIRQEILSDLQKSAGRTRYADQNEKRYEGVFKAKYGVSPDDLRNAVMADVRTLHDMQSKPALDAQTVAAMDTLRGNFSMLDMTPGADFLKDSDDAKAKLAALLSTKEHPVKPEELTPARLRAELKKQLDDPASAYHVVKSTYDISQDGAKALLASQNAPVAIQNNPVWFFNLVENKDGQQDQLIAAIETVEKNRTDIAAAPSTAPSVPPVAAGGRMSSGFIHTSLNPAGNSPAAGATPTVPPAAPQAAPATASVAAADGNSVLAVQSVFTQMGLKAGNEQGKIDNDFTTSAAQLRNIVFAMAGKTPADPNQSLMANDVQEMKQAVAAFKGTKEYQQLKALCEGRTPEGLSPEQAEKIKGFEGSKSNPAQYAQLVLNAMVVSAAPGDAEAQKFKAIWNQMPAEMKGRIPAVLTNLENDKFFDSLQSVYGAQTTTATVDLPKSDQLQESIGNVQAQLVALAGSVDELAGQYSNFIDLRGILKPPSDAEVSAGAFGATSNDALAKTMLALKVMSGVEGNSNGAFDPKLREAIYTNPNLAMVASKLGAEQMDKAAFAEHNKAFQEQLKCARLNSLQGDERTKALSDAGITEAQLQDKLKEKTKLNQLDRLFLDLQIMQDAGQIDNKRAAQLTQYDLMMDIAYDKFLKDDPMGVTSWLKDFFLNSDIGKMIGQLLGAFGIHVERLWGDRSQSHPDGPEGSRGALEQSYKMALKHYNFDKQEMFQDVDKAMGIVGGVINPMFDNAPVEQVREYVRRAMKEAEREQDPEKASHVFAESIIRDANAYRENHRLALSGNPPGPFPGQHPAARSASVSGPGSSASGGHVGAAGGVARQVLEDGGAMDGSKVGVERVTVEGAQGAKKDFGIAFVPDNRPYNPQPIASAPDQVKFLQRYMADNEGKLGLSTKSGSYLKDGQPTGEITRNTSMALEELLVRAQLHAGRSIDQIEHKFDADNIELVQQYMKDKGVTEGVADKFVGILHELDAKPSDPKLASILDRCILNQVQVGTITGASPATGPQSDTPAPEIAISDVNDADAFNRYKEYNKGRECPAPYVFKENGEIYVGIVDKAANGGNGAFKILHLEGFEEKRALSASDLKLLKDNYSWYQDVDPAYAIQTYIEQKLCLEPKVVELQSAPARAPVEDRPAPQREEPCLTEGGGQHPARVYRDLPKLNDEAFLFGGELRACDLDDLYKRSEGMGSSKGGIPHGGYMLTRLDDHHLIISTRANGGAGEIEHRVVDLEKDRLEFGKVRECYDRNDPVRRIDDFLFYSRLEETKGNLGYAKAVSSYDRMSHVLEVPRNDGGFPYDVFDALEVVYNGRPGMQQSKYHDLYNEYVSGRAGFQGRVQDIQRDWARDQAERGRGREYRHADGTLRTPTQSGYAQQYGDGYRPPAEYDGDGYERFQRGRRYGRDRHVVYERETERVYRDDDYRSGRVSRDFDRCSNPPRSFRGRFEDLGRDCGFGGDGEAHGRGTVRVGVNHRGNRDIVNGDVRIRGEDGEGNPFGVNVRFKDIIHMGDIFGGGRHHGGRHHGGRHGGFGPENISVQIIKGFGF